MSTARSHRAFTLIEAAASTIAVVVLGTTGLIGLYQPPPEPPKTDQPAPKSDDRQSALGKARFSARQLKDSTQVRGIHQAMVIWAQNNKDRFPLPSLVDVNDETVKDSGAAKDTTANIFSMLIYNGSIAPELLISPLEKNSSVEVCKNYEFDAPKAAVRPIKAIWDPQLAASLGPDKKGNVSYAHLQPSGKRSAAWSNTFISTEAVLGTRGPETASVAYDEAGVPTPTLAKPDSLALSMLGDGKTWTGNIVFNDNHVELVKSTLAHQKPFTDKTATYKDAEGKDHPDLWFHDEPADKESVNTFLGIFTKAGAKPADFKSIWD